MRRGSFSCLKQSLSKGVVPSFVRGRFFRVTALLLDPLSQTTATETNEKGREQLPQVYIVLSYLDIYFILYA